MLDEKEFPATYKPKYGLYEAIFAAIPVLMLAALGLALWLGWPLLYQLIMEEAYGDVISWTVPAAFFVIFWRRPAGKNRLFQVAGRSSRPVLKPVEGGSV